VHGNTLLEIVWTVIPSLILLGLTIASQRVWADIRFPANQPKEAVQVEILAEQFAWNVRYPGPDGQFETEDDVTTLNQLHLPVGQVTLIRLRAKDVIHSFFVPEFRVKQDAVPGLPTQMWLEPTRAGEFEILCAELCGLGHYRMRGFATTESTEQFQAWLQETKANE
jgi:cytochrome c oxidase subunit 2